MRKLTNIFFAISFLLLTVVALSLGGCSSGDAKCIDQDNDGYGQNCDPGADCDDGNADIHPGATEVCNQLDDDCDNQTDEGDVCVVCVDGDQDGYDAIDSDCPTGNDCDDNNDTIYPGATEVCNQLDDDCDDQTDEDGVCPACSDGDQDGYGPGCTLGPDCDDGNVDINPGATEVCDQVDNDCDDQTDEDGVCGACVDADQDGHDAISVDCPSGDDCDDTNADVNPDAVENPRNNINDDCDGETDEAVASPHQGDVLINEVLIDGATDQDANGDGDIDGVDDEFVELVNNSGQELTLDGWTLWDSDLPTARHIFLDGESIPAGEALVVFGGGSAPDDITGAHFIVAQNNDAGIAFGLSLNNEGDVLTLYDDQMREVAVFAYGEDGIITAVQDESITRNPDITGDFAAHTTASGNPDSIFSPGTKVDGSNF